ncbi:hypothetical protein [Pseudomonas paraeruginosa]|uniref:hypothetical protein n=1 Tax=Pseudomonas paraeruginosa TaxID=2994495 RepID=UPI001A20B757|nr:hypothetical protein [Pseudomonas aeruginosa]MBG7023710.1 hypothetical protein [Pseudomonas aeruginosa]MBG7370052.1 hypothetical protein [Pseudomonas aeruginosa]
MYLTRRCWKCWPSFCKCPPTPDVVEQMKGDIFLLDRELQRENRRAREFSDVLRLLARDVIAMRDARMGDGGYDNVPPDMHELAIAAETALQVLCEERNFDRTASLYAAFTCATGESETSIGR